MLPLRDEVENVISLQQFILGRSVSMSAPTHPLLEICIVLGLMKIYNRAYSLHPLLPYIVHRSSI